MKKKNKKILITVGITILLVVILFYFQNKKVNDSAINGYSILGTPYNYQYCTQHNPVYLIGKWGECINGFHSRQIYYSDSCVGLSSLPVETESCFNKANTFIDTVKLMYNDYFIYNPKVKNALDRSFSMGGGEQIITDWWGQPECHTQYLIYVAQNGDLHSCLYAATNFGCACTWGYRNGLQQNWDTFWKYLKDAEDNNNYRTNNDAEGTSYLRIIAHSIWLDYHQKVPWKLNDYSDENLDIILYKAPSESNAFNPTDLFYYTRYYIKSNQVNTVIELVNNQGWKIHYGQQPSPPNNATSSGDASDTIRSPYLYGCCAASQLLTDIAENLNIPSYTRNNWDWSNWYIIGHCSSVFQNIGYIPHGDDIYLWGSIRGQQSSADTIISWQCLINNVIPKETSPDYQAASGENPGEESCPRGTQNLFWNTASLTDINNTCTPNWQVGDWSSCNNGIHTRSVQDLNNCNDNTNKPLSSEACSVCNPDWQCSQWSACNNNQQTRTCNDINNCNTDTSPITTQSCTITCTPNWQCSEWSNCLQSSQNRICNDLNNCNLAFSGELTRTCTIEEPKKDYTGDIVLGLVIFEIMALFVFLIIKKMK